MSFSAGIILFFEINIMHFFYERNCIHKNDNSIIYFPTKTFLGWTVIINVMTV